MKACPCVSRHSSQARCLWFISLEIHSLEPEKIVQSMKQGSSSRETSSVATSSAGTLAGRKSVQITSNMTICYEWNNFLFASKYPHENLVFVVEMVVHPFLIVYSIVCNVFQ